VLTQRLLDPSDQVGRLLLDGVDGAQQRQGDVLSRVCLDAPDSSGSGLQPLDERQSRGAAAVALGVQPRRHRSLVEPGGVSGGREAA
jgi:hypothetical protein